MTRPDVHSRRAVLVAGAAAVLTACTDSEDEATPTDRPAIPTEEAAIFDLSFETTHRFRPFELVAPGFVDVDQPGSEHEGMHVSEAGPVAPFAAVELEVERLEGSVVAGLASTSGDHVLAGYDPEAGRASIEIRRNGHTRVLRRRKVALATPFRFAFALCENQVTVLADTGAGWHPVLTERAKVARQVDLRGEQLLGTLRHAWGAGRGRCRLASVRAGLFGMTGLRDPHLVQQADGSPYVRDGKAFLTFTCAGLGFFQQAHWGVFELDPARPTELRQVAQLFIRREGLVLGDHAGQLVRDADRWLVANSAWGDFTPGSVHVRHTTTTADLLSGVHLLETVPTALPTSAGTWDPAITRLDGQWHVGFVESPSQDPFDFHPALAVSSGAEWTDDLTAVGAAEDLHQCEGPIIATVDGRTWLLASDKHGRCYPVFDLEMNRVGRLDAPYPTNIPHPQLVPAPDGGWLMVTFDGTQFAEKVMGYGGHGDVHIMRST